MYNELDDNRLIELYRSGDGDAFEELFGRYRNLVKRISRAYFLVGGDGDDLIQEGTLGLLKAADGYSENGGASFATFAAVCIENKIKTAVTSATRKGQEPLNGAVSLAECLGVYSTDTPLDKVILDESATELRDRLEKNLSASERTVLRHYLEGMSYAEIADAIRGNEKKVDNALQRIKRKLKNATD